MNTSVREQAERIVGPFTLPAFFTVDEKALVDRLTAALEAKEREVERLTTALNHEAHRLAAANGKFGELSEKHKKLREEFQKRVSPSQAQELLLRIGKLMQERDALKAELARRTAFTEEWMANPNKTKPETFEDWSKWMDGWNELKRLTITQEQEIRALKAEVERLRAHADLTQTILVGERDETRRLLGEARAYLTNAVVDDDSLMAAIRAFLSDPALARVLGEVGK